MRDQQIGIPISPENPLITGQQFGPIYPDLGIKVAKLRNRARNDPSYRHEHGEAVIEAIRRMNNAKLERQAPVHHCPCASGTWHSDGEAILKAVRQQNAARATKPGNPRSYRAICDMYDAAMAAKHAAIQPLALAA